MRILNIYVTKNFLMTGLVSIVVLTFGMMGVNLVKIFEFMSKGVPFSSAGAFLFYLMPMALSLTIPVSVLVSIMLVFGRMSADNEITAMRACGISIFQIISPIIIISFILTCLCLYLRLETAPLYSSKAKMLIKTVGLRHPLAILEPGRSVEYENYSIYVDDKIGENGLKDIQVLVLSKDRSRVQQDITASSGRIELDEEREIMRIILDNATVTIREGQGENPRITVSKEMEFSIDYGKNFNKIHLVSMPRAMTLNELFGATRFFLRNNRDTTHLKVELNQRIALGLSPIAFLLLGLPLAIRTSRRETSINLFLSVILAGVYFISIMIFQAFDSKPQYRPDLLLWIPNILYQAVGIYFLFKIAKT